MYVSFYKNSQFSNYELENPWLFPVDRLYRRDFCWLIVLGILPCWIGCTSQHPPTCPVSGKIVFADGAPLTTGGVVLCESIPAEGLPINARGAIRADGTFELTTFEGGDGAVFGKHRVLVRAKRAAAGYIEPVTIPRPVIDSRFESYQTSGLEMTVEEGTNEFTLVVERPAPSDR